MRITIEDGHTLKEWKEEQKRNDGSLWDFLPRELFDGSIEPQDGMTYWLIDGRLYETIID